MTQERWPGCFESWANTALEPLYASLAGEFTDKLEHDVWDGLMHAFKQAARQESPDYFQNFQHFLRWIRKVARNHILDVLERRGRSRELPVDLGDPHEALNRSALVRDTLQLLPPDERRILTQYYLEKQTDLEIGDQLYGAEGTPSARLQRARKRRKRAEAALKVLLLEKLPELEVH
jgi:RNA polymerase sigma factor (sigma-70 family)